MRRCFPLFAAVVPVLCGVLQFFLFKAYFSPMDSYPSEIYSTETYALVTVDESYNDRLIQELLGIKGTVSESSIEIPLDDFGFLRMIPLDGFYDHLEPFDPRDTGFAEQLRSFFVHEGKRLFFIPLVGISESGVTVRSEAQLHAHIASRLNGIPFTLSAITQVRSGFPVVYAALLAAACACALYFSRSRRLFLLTMPLLPAFLWCGMWAFLFAALLLAAAELLRAPFKELLVSQNHDEHSRFNFFRFRTKTRPIFRATFRKLFGSFKLSSFLIALIAVILALIALLRFHVVPFAVVYGTFALSMVLAFRLEAAQVRRTRHVPFVPIQMIAAKVSAFPLLKVLAPFALAFLAALFVPPFSPGLQDGGTEVFPIKAEYLVTKDEYLQYAEFQRTFSYRPLDGNGETYPEYRIDDDGLVVGNGESALDLWEIPEFPLEKITSFLVKYGILLTTHEHADMVRSK